MCRISFSLRGVHRRVVKTVIARAEADGEDIIDDLADRLASSAFLKVASMLPPREMHCVSETPVC
jgi:hypothetical protein